MFLGMMLGTDAHHMTGTCIRALWSSTLLQDSCCLTMGFIVGVLNVYIYISVVHTAIVETRQKIRPRLILWTVMQMDCNALGHLAPDCSSWGIPSRGTSWRNFVNVAGNLFLPWIRGANMMISRFLAIHL